MRFAGCVLFALLFLLAFSCKKDPPIYPTPPKIDTPIVVPPEPVDSVINPGTYLLFDADMDYNDHKTASVGPTSIYYCELDGSNIRRVSTPPPQYYDYRASVSPDGKRVIFTRSKTDNTDRIICISNLDGSNFKAVIQANGADYASFSPDGTHIVYARIPPGNTGHDIFVANIDGSNEKRLTTFSDFPGGDCNVPRWGKNGNIYFNTAVTKELTGFFSMAPDGSNLTLITSSIIEFLTLSADGTLALSGHDLNLFVSGIDGSNLKSLTDYPGVEPYPFSGATFSLDQKQVYFASNSKPASMVGLYRINITGYGLRYILLGFYEYPTVF